MSLGYPISNEPDHLVATSASTRFGADDFRCLFDHSGLCMVTLDRALVVQEVNADFSREFGWRNATLRGREVLHFVHRSARSHLGRQLDRLVADKVPNVTEHVLATCFGDQVVPVVFTATAVRPGFDLARVLVVVQPGRGERDESPVVDDRLMLSELDARILEGVAAGVSSVRLASALYLSRQGVEYHVSTMLRRLNVPNRTALVSRAYSLGLLSAGVWPPRVGPEFVK
ncbi:LuxR C-terminal-related transcriptional regulator [Saccharothrix sp. Mg75]|uniref:helix-turn-helix transcriptional regulator n=1 Tax=Saccharothrix sp. Mg75 TaxID=3445357 RepID=UPI003EEF13B7